MICVCFRCGRQKKNPLHTCSVCNSTPAGEDQIALSYMLSEPFMTSQKLQQIAAAIQGGQEVQLSPEAKASILASLRRVVEKKPPAVRTPSEPRGSMLVGWVIVAVIAVLFGCIFHPLPNYKWASYQNTIRSYESFVASFPSSDYTQEAREKIRQMREPEVWAKADESGFMRDLRDYVRIYPDGIHFKEASERLVQKANAAWDILSSTRSVTEIRNYLAGYPESTRQKEASDRIQWLQNDYDWVIQENKLEDYRRFVANNPQHPKIKDVEKRIIDLEVKEIAAGDYGEMPKAQPLRVGGSRCEVEIENQTGYELTVRYSGADSKKLVIAVGQTGRITLVPGGYQVAASVNAANVTNYYGNEIMEGGSYSSNFYIQTSFGGSSFSPFGSKRR